MTPLADRSTDLPAHASAIVFSHGNSFPAGTYSALLGNLRGRGYSVRAIEKFGHDPAYPVTDGWAQLVGQLADFVRPDAVAAAPAWLVGHSLGGLLSLMCAALHPELARGVVILDAPVVLGWRAVALALAKRLGLMRRLSPSGASSRRRREWATREEAFAHFRAKPPFARWPQPVLHDYIEQGIEERGGAYTLCFSPEIETRIYETLPHTLGRLLRDHPLRCPVAFIGGLQSEEVRQAGGPAATVAVAQGRCTMLDGSHLFPLEHPLATAAAIDAHLSAMAQDLPALNPEAGFAPGCAAR